MSKRVYFFGGSYTDGKAEMKNLLGGKGANLAEMAQLGVPVPPGFTITTDVCTEYYENDRKTPEALIAEVEESLKKVEELTGMKFADPSNPLLLSVRSGARVSMPGMMDTVLNLGLNETTLNGIIAKTNNERFGWDSYRRFIQMYSNVVMGMKAENKDDEDPFEEIIDEIKKNKGIESDIDLDVEDLKEIVTRFKALVKAKLGKDFPTDPYDQLWGAIGAVFDSWHNDRAYYYRRMHNIDDTWGTAVNVQSMVFGNMGDSCATGVAFTRNPSTGENLFFGEYLINAQGEDVVAGTRTPQQITITGSKKWAEENGYSEEDRASNFPSLEESMPEVFKQLDEVQRKLENHYKDMQDIEFTIQEGALWLLQTRTGKRTSAASVKIAKEMCEAGLIDKKTALLRVDPQSLDQLLHPTFDPNAKKEVIAKGLPASPGAATGKVVFNAEDAADWVGRGEDVILVRIETSPEDLKGMNVSKGILTTRGGMTSHAAVVARGMGKCCVSGCSNVEISYAKKVFKVGGITVNEGDYVSLNGSTGEVMLGKVDTISPDLSGDFATIMEWAQEFRQMQVRTNADTPHDAEVAKKFGAEGIGLCRTEHMFFEGTRIRAMREMILAEDEKGRRAALKKLLPMQREDFYGILKAMDGFGVTIRLLDPPLHEFVPHEEENQEEMAQIMGVNVHAIKAKVESLSEFNPMLGHRGCRLGITYPEITEMQVRAIFEAAAQLKSEGLDPKPEIMVPLVSTDKELIEQRKIIEKVASEVIDEKKVEIEYKIGTMVETPRAALIAERIASYAEFFSFGTNDLTQMTYGFSRDDIGKFLPVYLEKDILKRDPFAALDKRGVGRLIKIAAEDGRKTRPDIKLGICGEHGGEPSSVEFCHSVGLTYVSCSPYRVPIARLAAAQAALKE